MFRLYFLRPGARVDSALAAVVADPVRVVVIDHRGVINVVNVGNVHVVDGSIVEKASPVPTSALVAFAEVAESVIDAAIESDVRAPVAFMENECGAAPTPPARCPQETDFRRHHPGPRYPIVICIGIVPGPVPRRPDITLGRARWLLVHRNRRRTKPDRYSNPDLREGSRGHQQHRNSQ